MEWTWVSGSDTLSTPGVYQTQGVPSASSLPGARRGSSCWTDSEGHFWLFGGVGLDENGNTNQMNDLWVFDPSTGLWTWVSGPKTNAQATGSYGTLGVMSSANIPGGRQDATPVVLPSHQILFLGGYGYTTTTTIDKTNDMWLLSVP